MDDIFNGLLNAGLLLQKVVDEGRNSKLEPKAPIGSWTHESAYVGSYFIGVGTKQHVPNKRMREYAAAHRL